MNTVVTKFKTKIDLIPKNPKDLNIIFAVSYAEYKGYVKLLEVLLLAQSFLKPALEDAFTNIDNETYSTITKGVGVLNNVVKSIIPSPFNRKVDVSVGAVGELLAVSCTDYFGSIPEDLFNMFQDTKNKINKFANMDMGAGMLSGIIKDLIDLKDSALKEMIGSDLFGSIISPLVAYEDFLKDNGILTIIARMERLERCMTKAGIAGRPRSDFMESKTHKLYSSYYKSLFMINSKGKLNVKSFGVSSKNKSQMNNVMKSVISFRIVD